MGSCCYGDSLTLALPVDSYSGMLLGDATDGPRGAGYEFDDIEFEAMAGDVVTIETTAADFDTFLYLLDEDCNEIAQDDDDGVGNLSQIVVTIPATGIYTIAVTSYLTNTEGSYTLELNPSTGPTTETSCTNGIDDDGDGLTDCSDPDCASDPACVGPTTETSCTDGVDNDSDGQLDCADSDCAADPACASCAVGACCYGDTLTLALPQDSYSGNLLSDATNGPRGSSYQFDDIEFEAMAGDVVTIETTSADFDTYLYLLDENCSVLTEDDDDGVGTLSQIVITIPATGVYTIAVTSYFANTEGAYTVALNPSSGPSTETSCTDGVDNDGDGAADCADSDCASDPACASCPVGSCCYGDTLTLSLPSDSYSGDLSTFDAQGGPRGSSYYFDDLEFFALAGESVTIEITSAAFDSYLHLLDENCTVVAYDDDDGAGLLSLIDYTAPSTGVYTIAVSTFSTNTTGAYTVQVY